MLAHFVNPDVIRPPPHPPFNVEQVSNTRQQAD